MLNKDLDGTVLNKEYTKEYGHLLQFAQDHNGITYEHFDSCVVQSLNLFALKEDLDFSALELALDRMIQDLPTFKRILSKPIIRLRDSDDILPVEAVRLMNNRTVIHASAHSELWEGVSDDSVRPRKLLTVQNKDHYPIYENLMVVRAIDTILSYIALHIRRLNDLLYTDQNMQFNLLERVNHLSYFLAIGKLHVGYVRNYDRYRLDAERCLEKLMYLDRILRARINCKLYKECKDFKGALPLKKTNIFRMHKDYHKIYLLVKWLQDHGISLNEEDESTDLISFDGYRCFCGMLTLFAAGHFNFLFDREKHICFDALDQKAVFNGWSLRIQSMENDLCKWILLTVEKENAYRILLLPNTDLKCGQEQLEVLKEQVAADEYTVLCPQRERGAVTVSLYDIESFRRLQQILFRAMIYADTERQICPFCGGELHIDPEKEQYSGYLCAICRTQIYFGRCTQTKEQFAATDIKEFSAIAGSDKEVGRTERMILQRKREALLHFRNITPIDEEGRVLCPSCGKRH